MSRFKLYIWILLVFLQHALFAQPKKIDSLLNVLNNSKTDTNKVNTLILLAEEIVYKNPDSTLLLASRAIEMASSLYKNNSNSIFLRKIKASAFGISGVANYYKGEYQAALKWYFKAIKIDRSLNDRVSESRRLNNMGNVYSDMGDYPKAIDYYLKTLKIDQELKDKKGICIDLGNIGLVYTEQANYSNALEYLLRALKMAEEIDFKSGISIYLGNIGIIHQSQENYSKALSYYEQAYKLAVKLEDVNSQLRHLGNIGTVYHNLGNYTKALEYYFNTLKIQEKIKNKKGIGVQLGNIGIVFMEQGDSAIKKGNKEYAFKNKFPKAMEFYEKALLIKESIGEKHGVAILLGNLASLQMRKGEYKNAEINLKKALSISYEIKGLELTNQFELWMSELYDSTNQHKLAYEHFKKHISAHDSISNNENSKKQTQMEMQYEFDKKQAADSIKNLEKAIQENIRHNQEIKQQKIYAFGGIIGFGLMLIVALVSFRAYRQKQKANAIIAQQKLLVEMKQQEVLDSIHYAKRIQQALLPSERMMIRKFKELKK